MLFMKSFTLLLFTITAFIFSLFFVLRVQLLRDLEKIKHIFCPKKFIWRHFIAESLDIFNKGELILLS